MIERMRLARGLVLSVMALSWLAAPLGAAQAGMATRSYHAASTYSTPRSGGYSAPRSSPGYSAPRPASPGYSSPGYAPPRPSGGYSAAPGYRPPSSAAAPAGTRSAGDAALARRSSAGAYTSYRATQTQFRAASAPPPRPPANSVFAHVQPVPSYSVLVTHRNAYYSGWGYVPQPFIYGYAPHFGIWDAIFIWSLASAASNAAQADWFYHHQYDPGYVDWRRQADQEAQQNAELRQQLATIDQRVATLEAQNAPRDPNYLPPGADPSVALAAENVVSKDATDADVDVGTPAAGSGHLFRDLLLAGLAIGIVVFAMRRRFA